MQHISRYRESESAGRFQASRCARASAMPGLPGAGLRGPVGGACAGTRRQLWVLLALLATLSGAAGQDSRSVRRTEVEQRRALLIGNAAYQHVRPLQNTVADVEALEGALRDLGFEVTVEQDRGVNEMDADLKKFAESLSPQDLAFFYFSGHGVEVSGKNYLLPVDFPESGVSIQRGALAAADVQESLEREARVRVLVLDACRNDPFGEARGTDGGLARMNGTAGTLIAYSTGAGNVASDNSKGELGLYMTHLVKELRKPGAVELGAVFDQTQDSVFLASKLAHPERVPQDPEISDKVIGKVYLRGGPEVDPTPGGGDKDRKVVPVEGRWEKDWRALENIKDPAMKGVVEEYIEDYESEPDARLWVKKARVVLATLEERQDAVAAWTAARVAGARADLVAFVARYGEVAPDLAKEAAGMLERLQEAELKVQEAGSSWKSPLGMEFAWIPAGDFEMGSPEGEAGREDDERQHGVRISEGFWIGKYEVTQREWELVMGSNPSYFKGCRPRCPVENVSWEDVQGFIQKLNEDEREAGSGNRYRLPSEAEWEYAARAGSAGATPEGDLRILGDRNAPVLDGQAWYGGNSGVSYAGGYDCSGWEERQYGAERCGPHPVGLKKANGWGLHDMLGNVWEWTADWYGDYPSGMVTDPRGPSTGSGRVGRGGGWDDIAGSVRSAYRGSGPPGGRYSFIGFRLVRTN